MTDTSSGARRGQEIWGEKECAEPNGQHKEGTEVERRRAIDREAASCLVYKSKTKL